ncbi:suppressor of fused domain protein [Pseudomonas syringae]|uniref:suppressor of fused domain protein n=1 Tax=Pseudomonas syringae TaxID=317 RepID=UPI00137296C4|nr:suppressor of fused domain protein [Pseudomonas syringae]NAT26366.1 hypothetical protein [Pseudomonas syringae pv. actinidifoliorum]NAT37244.1 hypothetical protein [Pseudomonas syringae pv. actinidifoliorum]
MKIPPSRQLKAVAKHILNFFGGTPTVHAYYDDARARSMSIVTTLDTVEPGIKSIGTIGLSEAPLVHDDGTDFITRIELCSAVPSHVEAWENVIASAAFFIEHRKQPVIPGRVLEDAVNEYFPNTQMPHLYFSIPFLWNDGHFEELLFADIQINWLQCFAIHETEKYFVSKYGSDSFESLLTEQEINVLDMEREPVSLPYRYSR